MFERLQKFKQHQLKAAAQAVEATNAFSRKGTMVDPGDDVAGPRIMSVSSGLEEARAIREAAAGAAERALKSAAAGAAGAVGGDEDDVDEEDFKKKDREKKTRKAWENAKMPGALSNIYYLIIAQVSLG